MGNRGRPRKNNYATIRDVLEKQKQDLLSETGDILPRTNKIWETLSKETNCSINALYAHLHRMRKVELSSVQKPELKETFQIHDFQNSTDFNTTTCPAPDSRQFTIQFHQDEFKSLLETRTVSEKIPGENRSRIRNRLFLKKNEWELPFTRRIWETAGITCGFHFGPHQITPTTESGKFVANCACGSAIDGKINNIYGKHVTIDCYFIKGTGKCSKTFIRGSHRLELGEKLKKEKLAAKTYKKTEANKLMEYNEKEPGFLMEEDVLRQLKYEANTKSRLDPDVACALHILKHGLLKGIVRNIGYDPFIVHYWSTFQLHQYKILSDQGRVTVELDASGGFANKISYKNGLFFQVIFLYQIMASPSDGSSASFPAAQMLSAKHDTNALHGYLLEWVRSGAKIPDEAVMDGSLALLTAAVRAFTSCETIRIYADKCFNAILSKGAELPRCYIRSDVAHKMKMWRDFLHKTKPDMILQIKKFYLGAIGQAIMADNLEKFQGIIKALLIISRSIYDGKTDNGHSTPCGVFKNKIKELITKEKKNSRISMSGEIGMCSMLQKNKNATLEKLLGYTNPYRTSQVCFNCGDLSFGWRHQLLNCRNQQELGSATK